MRHIGQAVGLQRLYSQIAARQQDHACLDMFPPQLVRHTINRHLGHIFRELHDDIYNLHWIDILSARYDHIIPASTDVQKAILVQPANISGVVPTVFQDIVVKRFVIRNIAMHLSGTPDYNFPGLSWRTGQPVRTFDSHFNTRNWPANGGQVTSMIRKVVLWPQNCDNGGHLSHAIRLVKITVELFHSLF